MEEWIESISMHTPQINNILCCRCYVSSPVLHENTFTEMVNSKWFDEDKKVCLYLQNLAKDNHVCVLQNWNPSVKEIHLLL